MRLHAEDHVAIERLCIDSLDSLGAGSRDFANAFTPDGRLVISSTAIVGSDALAAFAAFGYARSAAAREARREDGGGDRAGPLRCAFPHPRTSS